MSNKEWVVNERTLEFLKGVKAGIEDKVTSHFQFKGDLSEGALIDGLFQAKNNTALFVFNMRLLELTPLFFFKPVLNSLK